MANELMKFVISLLHTMSCSLCRQFLDGPGTSVVSGTYWQYLVLTQM